MNVAMSVGLVFAAILGAYLFVLWYGSATVIDKHEDRITVMENRWTEQFGGPEPAADDSPEAEEAVTWDGMLAATPPVVHSDQSWSEALERGEPDDAKTDEFPVAPPTVPDGIAIQVHSALIERPSPVPRGKSAEWVEAEIAALRARNAERMARAEEAS